MLKIFSRCRDVIPEQSRVLSLLNRLDQTGELAVKGKVKGSLFFLHNVCVLFEVHKLP